MVKPAWILTLLVLLAPAGLAFADEPAQSDSADAGELFSQLDENKDGQLAADEIPDDRRLLFDRLLRIGDKNDDGKLDADEFALGLTGGDDDEPETPAKPERPTRPARPERAPGALFERLDANGDGKVELSEVPEPGRERFGRLLARVDKDGDGAITRREFAQAGPRPDAKKRDAKKPGDAAKKRPPQAGRDPKQLFARMDRNSDGKLTADEVPEQRQAMLERMIKHGDKDGDESLSSEEFVAVFARRPNQPPGNAGQPKRSANAPRPVGLFVAIDANRDGELDSAEIAAAEDAIRKLDKNGDGSVSQREVLAAGGAKNKKKQGKKKKNE